VQKDLLPSEKTATINITEISTTVDETHITPLEPATDDTLICNFTIYDPDEGDVLTADVTWEKSVDGGESWIYWIEDDETDIPVENGMPASTSFQGNIESEKLSLNEQWKCIVTGKDNYGNTDTKKSDAVSIRVYAWSENGGWLNFGSADGNVGIADTELTGYVWGENIGWISLNCSNTNTCGDNNYKVANDGEGNLSGYAWSENGGWLNFNPTHSQVAIDSKGNFSGYAWGENIGWISLTF